MPELPEVENIKFGLEEVVINKKIVNIKYSSIFTLFSILSLYKIIDNINISGTNFNNSLYFIRITLKLVI